MDGQPPNAGETAEEIFFEKSTLAGLVVNAVSYGIHLTIAWLCLRLLWKEKNKIKRTYFFLAYTCMTLTLGTIAISATSVSIQQTFIQGQNFPGGPAGFSVVKGFSLPSATVDNFASIIGGWLSDAILVWRGITFYRGTRWIWVMTLPCLIYLAFIAMSIRFLIISTQNVNLASGTSILLPALALSQSLNAMVSILITVRLLLHRRNVTKALGRAYAHQYVTLIAMIIESASLSSSVGVTYLVLYSVKHPLQTVFLQALDQIQFISPLLIIHRVAQRRAWSTETSTLKTTSWSRGHPGIRVHLEKNSHVNHSEEIPMPVITRTVQYTTDNGERAVETPFAANNDYMMDVIDISAQTAHKTEDADVETELSTYSVEGSMAAHQTV